MKIIEEYFLSLQEIMVKVLNTQLEAMEQAATLIADAILKKHALFAFGTNHAGILAQELYYRTGGLAVMNYIRMPGLSLDIEPPTLTTEIERLPGYGTAILHTQPIKNGDVLIFHSVSGRNAVPIDLALSASEKGITTICLTNMSTASAVTSRHSSGKSLHEICDLVIDNCGNYGDAVLEIPGFPEKVAPSSTAVGAAIFNAIVAKVVEIFQEKGIEPPVFISSNIPGGDEHNKRIMQQYREQIYYMK